MATPGSRTHTASASLGRVLLVLLGLSLAILGLAPWAARAPPPIPMTTQGNAYDASGAPLPTGTVIRTFVDGVDYSNDTSVLNAQGAFAVATNGSLTFNSTTPEPSPVKTGAYPGEPMYYGAGSFATQLSFFQEVVAWHTDLTVTQALHLGSAQTTPKPLRIQGIVTQPARGGPQYAFLCNPTASNLSLADYYLQVDRPGTYYGGNLTLGGNISGDGQVEVNLSTPFSLIPTGDALKLVYRNPGGAAASAGGKDIVIDRVEFNATENGTLDWQPGATILGSAPAPGPGQILERAPACSAALAPRAFRLAPEPGLPAIVPPSVTVSAPIAGQNVQGGQVFTIRWNMSDPVFITSYLRVWVNVTYLGTTRTLLAGATGATSVDWNVPDVNAPNANVVVRALNPFGASGNATATFNVVPATPYSVYVAVLVIVVIAVFILVAFYYARRKSELTSGPPPAGGPPPAAPAPETVHEATPPGPATPGTKVCPKCGTAVQETDGSCFYCGHLFVTPPP